MAKKKRDIAEIPERELAVMLRPTMMDNPVVPTQNPRHMSHIREGRISGEIFSRANRAKIMVDADISEALFEEENIRKMKQRTDKKRRAAK